MYEFVVYQDNLTAYGYPSPLNVARTVHCAYCEATHYHRGQLDDLLTLFGKCGVVEPIMFVQIVVKDLVH